ncbi:protein-glutamate O-methyltransferase [Endobacter medicaginis]|uniref:Chemotaxis protein methyltransferase n=2 Tax=Endobacter medicaginis TaxID=1181271 RepID=A0A850NMQ4_9PROT|nr:protein-glutamate O-methyltransferase [Endobacter medicaginis]
MSVVSPIRPAADVGAGDFAMTAADFAAIAELIYADSGIVLGENKVMLVYSRVAKRLRALRMTDFGTYCAFVRSPQGGEERGHLLNALTTNVTSFFREKHHFDHLATTILPPAIQAARRGARVRLWSSACSSGQEPYSIALTLLCLMPDAGSFDIRILATDIDNDILETARRGVYPRNLAGEIPPDLRRRGIVASNAGPDCFAMSDDVRALVAFRTLNLVRTWPMRARFQAIFCRNVMIYLDHETQSQIWARMVPLLSDDGALYIGHSERVCGPAAGLLHLDGITTYRPADHAPRRGQR